MKKFVLLFIVFAFSFSMYSSELFDKEFIKAVSNGDLKKVQKLLADGVDINVQPNFGVTALMTSLQGKEKKGDKEIFEFLMKSGADVKLKNSNNGTALHSAAQGDRVYAIETLIKAGCNINDQNDQGYSPLMLAIFWKRTDTAKLLIDLKADFTIKNNKGKTAFAMAKEKGLKEVVSSLEKAGAVE